MDSRLKFQLIQTLNKKNNYQGFTLIELLVVVIIIGVLAAIALPNLLGQVAKGRQSEARNNLGSLNRAQQAYRAENAVFAPISNLPINITSTYYQPITGGTTTSAVGFNHQALPETTYTNDILEYESAVGQQSNGTFSAVVCEQTTNPSSAPGSLGSLSTPGTDTTDATCTTSARRIL
jgi:prepilin-type N-terminal cleavage/methylation domain-containing protein